MATPEEKLAALEEGYAKKLPDAVVGHVTTRFPPEPSGYLHIGHAKAALVNAFYARYFQGSLIIRFDDTNPTKENADFETSILEDLEILGISLKNPEKNKFKIIGPTYTSDYFARIEEAAEKLVRAGKAYVDDTPTEKMREERFRGDESASRTLPVEENLRRWQAMREGTAEGQTFCLRAKIDMKQKNKCMRDPVLFRVNVANPHHRTGTKFKTYPCYDMACPLVDSWSGVTHSLRTNEYADRIPQYYWVQDACEVRRTIIYEFSRLNFTNTVLSKRKLQWLIDTGIVDTWDDPRFPTVRGLRRHGLQIAALHEFLIEQGPSKNVNIMEWDKLWAKNAKIIDVKASRFMAVNETGAVEVEFSDAEGQLPIRKPRPLHPRFPNRGEIELELTRKILLDEEDVRACEVGEEVTLMRMGNVILQEIRTEEGGVLKVTAKLNLGGDVKQTKKKLHWVPVDARAGPPVRCITRELDHIIVKKKPEEGDKMEDIVNRASVFDTVCLAEPGVGGVEEDEVIQFERRGFFRADRMEGGLRVMIAVPSGKTKAMSTLSTKVDAASLIKGGELGKSGAK